MGNVSNAVIQFLASSKTRVAILGLLVLSTGVFTTIYLINQRQDIRQRAAFDSGTFCVSDTQCPGGKCEGVQYDQQGNIVGAGTCKASGITATPAPTTTTGGGTSSSCNSCLSQGKQYYCPPSILSRERRGTCSDTNTGLCTKCTASPTPQVTYTPTPSPIKTPLNMSTPFAYVKATDFTIIADGKTFKTPPSFNRLTSDPGSQTYTTLEAEWILNNIEMRINLYFAYTPSTGKWEVTELRTYNGKQPGDWTYYSIVDQNNQKIVQAKGQAYKKQGETIFKSTNYPNNTVTFENIDIQAFFANFTPTPTTNPACAGSTGKQNGCACSINAHCTSGFCAQNGGATGVCQDNNPTSSQLTCDPNRDGVINILDFQWWKDEMFGTRTTKESDCFSPDGVVNILDFQVWKDIAITKIKQPF